MVECVVAIKDGALFVNVRLVVVVYAELGEEDLILVTRESAGEFSFGFFV